jgi:hypothetical protein
MLNFLNGPGEAGRADIKLPASLAKVQTLAKVQVKLQLSDFHLNLGCSTRHEILQNMKHIVADISFYATTGITYYPGQSLGIAQ